MTVLSGRTQSAIGVVLAFAAIVASRPADASFHNWEIAEIYSNADGTVLYIELSTTSGSEGFVGGHTLEATSTVGGTETTRSFTLPAGNLGNTANRRLLFATATLDDLPGAPTPDYTLAAGFIDPDATSIEIDFVGADTVTFNGAMPVDGRNAVHFTTAGASSIAAASPQNFAGSNCALVCPAVGACNSNTGGCGECASDVHCQAGASPCTDRTCNEEAFACVSENNSDPCEDGSFCTSGDVCSGGACQGGAGSPCTVDQVCDETNNQCDECDSADDCADADFCNGPEACNAAGSCVDAADPCDEDEICDEPNNQCDECDENGDCNDVNVCTTDTCGATGSCVFTNNTNDCDDGLFCNGDDTCSGGACTHEGSPCPVGDNCNEGTDFCGDCEDVDDCDDENECTADACTAGDCDYTDVADDTPCTDDGLFCNGDEVCQSGECVGEGDPCIPGVQSCDEASNACSANCGNGAIDGDEECDDGDTEDLDGCDASCLEEPGYTCLELPPDPVSVCASDCGDGILAEGAEDCDDGDEDADDGCDDACEIEEGWDCFIQDSGPDVCDPIFGDGLIVGDEVCDDGNDDEGDGCFEGAVEAEWECDDSEPSLCEPHEHPEEEVDDPVADEPLDVVEPTPDAGTPDAAGDAAEPTADTGSDPATSDDGCCSTARTTTPDLGNVLLTAIVFAICVRRRGRTTKT